MKNMKKANFKLPRSNKQKSTWSSSTLILAGVLVNLMLLCFLFYVMRLDATPNTNSKLPPSSNVQFHQLTEVIQSAKQQLQHFREKGQFFENISSSLALMRDRNNWQAADLDYLSQFKAKKSNKRIAFAITITKDGSFQDGAAVLAYSIFNASLGKPYEFSLVAFVHPSVVTSRPVLSRLGYHVIEVPTPINTSAIPFQFLREKINKNGCCGAAELIKLNSYRLTQYEKVVHMDADTYFLHDIDELFNDDHSLIYTTDPNMASHPGDDKLPVQGGFIVFTPNVEDYEQIMNIFMTTPFTNGGAWNRSKIGWYWGGMTVQGVLPYYYNKISSPTRMLRLDRCIYNTMADTEECSVQTLDQIKSAHFTVCQKPWTCYRAHANSLCSALHKRWFQVRLETELFYGLVPEKLPCGKWGPKQYRLMDLDKAQLPMLLPGLRKDDSPDRLLPIGNNGYLPNTLAFH